VAAVPEEVLLQAPRVADAAVFGVPNDEYGEEIKAVIQPAHPDFTGPAAAEALKAYSVRPRLPGASISSPTFPGTRPASSTRNCCVIATWPEGCESPARFAASRRMSKARPAQAP